MVLHGGHRFEPGAAAVLADGFRVAAIVAPQALIDPTQPDLFDAGYPAWCDALTAARSQSIPLLVGQLADPPHDAPARHDDLFRYAIDSLRKLRFDAERCSVRMAVQVGPRLAWSVADVRELIDEANSFWVGVEFDFSSAASPTHAEDALALLAHRVVAVRVRETAGPAAAESRGIIDRLRLDVPIIVDPPEANAPTR